MKRYFAFFLSLCMALSMISCAKQKSKELNICDKDGNVVATLSKFDFSEKDLSDPSYRDYVRFVLDEAVDLIVKVENCDEEKAKKMLFQKGYTVNTYFDAEICDAVLAVYKEEAKDRFDFDCAVETVSGEICALFGSTEDDAELAKHSPFSTIKPLSVYAPAMENGLIDWGTMFSDTPYKQIISEDGRVSDWPMNAGAAFTYKNTLLADCIKQSLNTTAVHCLKLLGVKKSVVFLTDSFGMNLQYEQNKLALQGEEEIIGNIAMGYLNHGFTAVDLAGYYQIFGRLGEYSAPKAIRNLTSPEGEVLYENKKETKKVISEETASLMNQLLKQVVSPGGTGEKAFFDEKTQLIGKTGTGNDDGGNWFVGVTPQYSCAIWHSVNEERKNVAAELFSKLMEKLPEHTLKEFQTSSNVKKSVFCSETGDLLSSTCSYMHIGYYAPSQKIGVCKGH